MAVTFLVRFRPTAPWRFGPDSGARGRVEPVLHSDAVFSAVTGSMARLGGLEDWLNATARREAGAGVRFSSLFPFSRDALFAIPPRSVWPPAPSAKVRYKGARFVPLEAVETLLNGDPLDEDRWALDAESECLIPSHWHTGPFRSSLRSSAAVDRLEAGKTLPHATACLEFARDAGLWMRVVFDNQEMHERWERPLQGALRWLADSGLGGGRSRGWGRSLDPEWSEALPVQESAPAEGTEQAYWLLSVFTPAGSDSVDWNRGNYAPLERSGRIESAAQWGELKASTPMIAEGSVLLAGQEPAGAARDIAPPGFPHPVYRAGFAVSIPISWRNSA